MKKASSCSLVATRILGALLSAFALLVAAFASDSGAQDPLGARVSSLMIWMPVVFLVCTVASLVSIGAGREKIALALSTAPILYFVGVLFLSG